MSCKNGCMRRKAVCVLHEQHARARGAGMRSPTTRTRQQAAPGGYHSLEELRALALLVTADLKVLATLDGVHVRVLASRALQAQHDLLGRLGL